MRSFLHTVQKNQLLMMTPSSLGRTSVMKSFIKQSGKLEVKVTVCSPYTHTINAKNSLLIKVFHRIVVGLELLRYLIIVNQLKAYAAHLLS